MAALIPGTVRAKALGTTPSAPPSGYVILYFKTDNVLYIQGSDAVEHAIGTVNDITALHGDVMATGPGDVEATVVQVGGKLAADIAQSVTDTQNATALNVINTIVKRDSSGNIFVTQINGVTIEAHASRHLPNGADPITTAAPASDLTANTTNATGTANSLARSDHSHAIDTGAPSTQHPDQINAAGTSPNLARADHVHDIPTAAPTTDLTSTTPNAQGSANTFARSDHTHAIDTDVPVTQGTDNSNAAGVSPSLAKADHIHNIPTDVPVQVNANGSNVQGSSAKFARADHKHDIATDVPVTQPPNHSNAAGSSASLARADHVHTIPTAAPITQGPDNSNADGSATTFSKSDHVHDIPTDVASGLDSTSTNTKGSSSSFARADHTHAIASGAPATQTPDQSNSAGTSPNFAKADHIHDIPTGTPVDVGSSNAQGTAAAFARQDHVHKGVHSVNANGGTQEFGDISLQDGSGVHVSDLGGGAFKISATNAAGEFVTTIGAGLSVNYTAGTVLINGTYTSIASGSISVGPSITNGWIYVTTAGAVASGSSLPAAAIALAQFTSDATNVTVLADRRTFLDQNIQYGTPSTDLTATTTNSQGTNDAIARSDHTHAIDTGTPSTQNTDQSNATGTSPNLARADHIHNIPTDVPVQVNANGTNAQGSSTKFAKADHKHDIATDVPVTQTPDQSNAAGSSSSLARADHVHDIPSATPVQIGTSNSRGSAASFALSDHVHDHGAQTSPTLHAVATDSVNGFMSAADKTKLDAATPLDTASTIMSRDSNKKSAIGEMEFESDALFDNQASAPSNPSSGVKVYTSQTNGFNRLRMLNADGTIFAFNRDIFYICYNNTGSSLAKGQLVYINGTFGTVPTVALAKANSSTTAPAVGLVIDAVATGNYLRVQVGGSISGFDTSAFTAGSTVYLSSTVAGGLTATEPLAPNISQAIGTVTNSNVSGSIDLTIRAALNTASGTYRSSFQVGPGSGALAVALVFANANLGTLQWTPTGTRTITIPDTTAQMATDQMTTSFKTKVVVLTDAANIATDASLGNVFRVTLGGNRNLSAPTNPTDGQKITYEISQDGTGGRGLTFDSAFNFGLDIQSFTPSSGANKVDYIGCIYKSSTGKWNVIAVAKGF